MASDHAPSPTSAEAARNLASMLDFRPPGAPAWWRFVAARFPEYADTASTVALIDDLIARGSFEVCRDIGHEFWCRLGEDTCHRLGVMTCNETAEEAAALDAAMEARRG